MTETWTSFNKAIEVPVCILIKRRKGKYDKWEYTEISRFAGDWHDLVDELYRNWNQFGEEIVHLSKASARSDRLDTIADKLAKADFPYEFMLPDGTDEWYIAYCKPVTFRISSDGGLR